MMGGPVTAVVAGALPPPAADLTGVCFRDQLFLNFVGGNLVPHNVFDYFAESPFYDRSCSNEQLRMQGIHPLDMDQLKNVGGRKPSLEYILASFQEPHLFTIKKQLRDGEKATGVALYYVLDGSIYQAPSLYGALGARMSRALHHIQRAFEDTQKQLQLVNAKEAPGSKALKGGASGQGVTKRASKPAAGAEVDLVEATRVGRILEGVFKQLPPTPPPPSHVAPSDPLPPASDPPDWRDTAIDTKGPLDLSNPEAPGGNTSTQVHHAATPPPELASSDPLQPPPNKRVKLER
eukprot:TRINITY_DN23533_c0_g1_i1.p1 TRINITY_DN23533_c0_g1~~TRINITY_DN23533_c0_g1_i1.p1  ORF type:complete len:292 (+),score=57.75 TRINITY_DN23533_c0_g1_i1:720-1595(+)